MESGGHTAGLMTTSRPNEHRAISDATRRLVERFYHEAWNNADASVARAILDANLEFRGSIGEARRGVDEFVEYMRRIHAVFGGYHCRIDDLIAAGDRAAAQMTFGGIHKGSLFGEEPTGMPVNWGGAAFFTTGAGRIRRVWVLGDTENLKRGLGLLP